MSKTKRKRLFTYGLLGLAVLFVGCLIMMGSVDLEATAFATGLPLVGLAGALAADRDTVARTGDRFSLRAATAKKFYAGALVMRSATGYATPGAVATGCVGLGRVAEQIDNTDGGNGDVDVSIDRGVFRFGNSADADAITLAEVGNICYIVDDATVAKTDGAGTRSPAGRIFDVDSSGVWVEFIHMAAPDSVATADIADDAVTNAKLANIARGSVKVGGAANAPTDLDAKGDAKILVGDGADVKSVSMSGDVTIDNAGATTIGAKKVTAAKTAIAQGKVFIGDAGGAAAEQTISGDVTISEAGVAAIGADKVMSGMIKYKSVVVTVAVGQPSGASAADPDLVGGEILGVYPTANQDQLIDSVALGGDGAVTVTLAANATAENNFKVVVLQAA